MIWEKKVFDFINVLKKKSETVCKLRCRNGPIELQSLMKIASHQSDKIGNVLRVTYKKRSQKKKKLEKRYVRCSGIYSEGEFKRCSVMQRS